MNVSLTPELEDLVRQKVETGRYTSASEVVREALRLMEERDRLDAWRKDEIRAQIAAGLASLRAWKGEDGEAVFDRLDAEIGADEDWLRQEVVPSYDAMKTDPSRVRSVADVRAALAAEHEQATKKAP